MNKGALALLVHGGTENWSPVRWKSRFDDVCPNLRVLLLPETSLDPAEVHYAAVWKPHPGELAAFPNFNPKFINTGFASTRLPPIGSKVLLFELLKLILPRPSGPEVPPVA